MFWYSLHQLIAFLLDILRVVWQPLDQKDLEILFLRQQLAVVRRRQKRAPTLSRFEKLLFATLITQNKRAGRPLREQLGDFLLLFQPDTLLRWHRDLVRKKWTYACMVRKPYPYSYMLDHKPIFSGKIAPFIAQMGHCTSCSGTPYINSLSSSSISYALCGNRSIRKT